MTVLEAKLSFDNFTTCNQWQEIQDKVLSGVSLSREEAIYISENIPTALLGKLADSIRSNLVGNDVIYATTFYVHPTNLCELSCPLCSFYAKPGWKTAWFKTPEQIEKELLSTDYSQFNEIHIVGGLWRDCDLNYYENLFTRLKKINPNFHIKALTPVEYDFLAHIHNIPVEQVLKLMKDWGLGSIPGGGAEILKDKIRATIAPQKINSERFLEVHEIAHSLDIPTNMTMLYGHIETYEDIIDHLIKVRNLQTKTNGFKTFIPLKFHVENNTLGKRKNRLQPKDPFRVYALSRIVLNNIPNMKALWNYVGYENAQRLLHYGVNDLSSTNTEEKIIVMAGGIESEMTEELLCSMITKEGRNPLKKHSG